ncbi:hypothetical protein DMB92_03890 [Campylobacter sp. MIT 99-7217]|uniref:TSUP family transporter n=1 Tax=Campylobacter sp. MIT 99-7217 TaxID=535091 RepID=UPI0011571254|nr:TSUP family transporter [Campylobacter sp. MIT 99-7217]TQR33109.1 hypothetical protein DMB92_03890 [Campylobacter sp. MIT 99-7217]
MEGIIQIDTIYYFILFFVAIFAGFVDAIVGGGGLITLPALMASGIPPHLALSTNKLQSVFGSFTAMLTYFKARSLAYLGLGVLFTALGATMGAILVLYINDKHLKLIVLVFLALTFIYTALKPNLGKHKGEAKINIKLFHFIFGLILGFYDGFLGPGTGSFWIFACVVFLGLSMKEASINTKILNFTSNIIALIVFLCFYKLLWDIGILMGVGQIIGAYLGSKLVLKTEAKFIKKLFLAVVFLTLLKVTYDYFMS